MSLLRMTCIGVGTLDLKVTGFNTGLRGVLNSAQTKTKLQHFPFKADQQSLQLQVVCNGWPEYRTLQDFVRGHHLNALPAARNPEVDLWWPERGMYHWTGYIKKMQAGDDRFNIAPKASLEILLVDSLLSEKTWSSSLADPFEELYGSDIGGTRDPNDPIYGPPLPQPGRGADTPGGVPGESSGGSF